MKNLDQHLKEAGYYFSARKRVISIIKEWLQEHQEQIPLDLINPSPIQTAKIAIIQKLIEEL